jgi:hypothetical protein
MESLPGKIDVKRPAGAKGPMKGLGARGSLRWKMSVRAKVARWELRSCYRVNYMDDLRGLADEDCQGRRSTWRGADRPMHLAPCGRRNRSRP